MAGPPGGNPTRTIFANRSGGPLSPYNVRRTFREFLELAGLAGSGISLRWYRRTGATVIARGIGTDAAAAFLGHASTVITEGHYIEPDRTVDPAPAGQLERTLRPAAPDDSLLARSPARGEDALLAAGRPRGRGRRRGLADERDPMPGLAKQRRQFGPEGIGWPYMAGSHRAVELPLLATRCACRPGLRRRTGWRRGFG